MVANVDEKPIWADMPSTATIEERGPAPSLLEQQGMKKRASLCVEADGTKLKLYIVIPAKKVKKKLEAIPAVVVAAGHNGWMNEELTADWIEKIWTNFSFTKLLLVWNSFKCHISDARKEQLKQYNIVISVIPGGCTKFLQPLHVCISKPFKLFFCKLYDNWFQKGEFVYTSMTK